MPFALAILSLIFAVLLALLLVSLVGWRRPGRDEPMPAVFFLFCILFLVIWAAGAWIEPYGPTAWGVAWVPLLVVGGIVALVIVAAAPPRRPRQEVVAGETAAEAALNTFFWILVLVLAVVVVAGLL